MTTQVVISGLPRSGATLLYAMWMHGRGLKPAAHRESALEVIDTPRDAVTAVPRDVFDLDKIIARNELGKELRLVLTVRDPRSVIVSESTEYPDQPFVGFDQSLRVEPTFLGYSDPGLIAYADAIRAAHEGNKLPVRMIRFEDLVCNPDDERLLLRSFAATRLRKPFAAFHQSEMPQWISSSLGGLRPLDESRLRPWMTQASARRIVRQFRLEPRLFEALEHWGYETDRDWYDKLAEIAPEGLADRRGLIVGFYTEDDLYKREARRLEASANRLGLPIELSCVQSRGSWLENVRLKVSFLQDCRRKHHGPLLYVDVDAVLHKDPWPLLSAFEGDAAFCILRDGKARSGTMLFADTPGATSFLEDWSSRLTRNKDAWDQHPLDEIVLERRRGHPSPYRVQFLPPSLCYIFDRSAQTTLPGTTPIVEHLQASRESRTETAKDLQRLDKRHARIEEVELNLFGSVLGFFNEVAELSRSESVQTENRLDRYSGVLDTVFRLMHPLAQSAKDMLAEGIAADLKKRLVNSEANLASAQIAGAEARARAETAEIELSAARKAAEQLGGELATVRSEAAALRAEAQAEKDKVAELLAESQRSSALNSEAQVRLSAALSAERDRVSRLELYTESMLSVYAVDRQTAERRVAELDQALTSAKRDRSELTARLQAAVRDSDALAATLQQANCDKERLANDLQKTASEQEGLAAKLQDAERERDKLLAELQRLKEGITASLQEVRHHENHLAEKLQRAERDQEGLALRLKQSEARVQDLNIACAGYLARIEDLKRRRRLFGR